MLEFLKPELIGCCSIPQHSFILENVMLQCHIYCYVVAIFFSKNKKGMISSQYRSSLYKEDHNLAKTQRSILRNVCASEAAQVC